VEKTNIVNIISDEEIDFKPEEKVDFYLPKSKILEFGLYRVFLTKKFSFLFKIKVLFYIDLAIVHLTRSKFQ